MAVYLLTLRPPFFSSFALPCMQCKGKGREKKGGPLKGRELSLEAVTL